MKKLFGLFTKSYTNCPESNIRLVKDKVLSLFNNYHEMVVEVIKIEKGERVIGDDIILIINEYVFELQENLLTISQKTVRT